MRDVLHVGEPLHVFEEPKSGYHTGMCGGFPSIRGNMLAVPMIRIIAFRGLHWGHPILGNYHVQ